MVPVFEHAFEKSLAGFEHRVGMCQLCMADGDRVQISRIERTLERPNYTLNTLRALTVEHPDYELRLVVGADVLRDASKWHRFDEIQRLAPLLPLGRQGVASDDVPAPVLPGVSSTQIRQLLNGRPPGPLPVGLRSQLLELVDPAVLQYIEQHELYR